MIMLRRRFFVEPSFFIYGGISGLNDLGPVGCSLKNNIVNLWRKHFVLKEKIYEIDTSILTSQEVLTASGHISRFSDTMVKDLATGELYRLDHLIRDYLENSLAQKDLPEEEKLKCKYFLNQLHNLSTIDFVKLIDEFCIKSPRGNELGKPEDINLMFSTPLGVSSKFDVFLRPELSQGVFVNFKQLLIYNHKKLPLVVCQIGKAFRNEILPKWGLIRAREFELAEIQHFYDPQLKTHERFEDIKKVILNIYSQECQVTGSLPAQMSVQEAFSKGLIKNQILAYYLARTYLFLIKIGIDPQRLRFRQHLPNEMSHYASECWDAECLTSFGWIECVGCADRSYYDLSQHENLSGQKMTTERKINATTTVQQLEIVINEKKLNEEFEQEADLLISFLIDLNQRKLKKFQEDICKTHALKVTLQGKDYEIPDTIIGFKEVKKVVDYEEFLPEVIEPSFGVSRILYCVLEHSFASRSSERTFLSLPLTVAPIKCSIFCVVNKQDFKPYEKLICDKLDEKEISFNLDHSRGSLGKKYVFSDQTGIPFAVTIDSKTVEERTVTLRERNSMEQIRIPVRNIGLYLIKLNIVFRSQNLHWYWINYLLNK